MYLKGAWDDCIDAFETLEEAIAALEEKLIEYGDEDKFESPDSECSLGIGIDEKGKYWFAVSIHPNTFTSCKKEDLKNWQDWYDEDWVEYEEFDRFGISFYYPNNPSKSTTNEDYCYKSEEEACFRAELERISYDSDEEVVIEVIRIKFRWRFLSDGIEEIDDTFELVDIF